MLNDEVKNEIESIHKCVAILAKEITDNRYLLIRLLAHQQANDSALRSLYKHLGLDVGKLRQGLANAYQEAAKGLEKEFDSAQQSGDAKKFLGTDGPDKFFGN